MSEPDDVVVTLPDIRSSGLFYCAVGTRQFFRRHGLDFADFLRNGIPAGVLMTTGDAMAERAVEAARQRVKRESANE